MTCELIGRFAPAAAVLAISVAALFASGGPAAAACTTTGTITFSIDCDGNYGPNATATTDGATLTIDGETFDDPTDGANSFSRIVLKAGSETSAPIDIGLTVTGTTVVDSHNSVGVYLLTKKGDITVDIGSDVMVTAQQSGVFAKADNSGSTAGGVVVVTNYGTIDAGYASGDFGAEGIRVRALQGAGSIYNYGTVTSDTGRGLRIDGGSVAGVSNALVLNTGSVEGWLDGVHINANAGSATIQNGVDGTIESLSQRGAVASSKSSSASLSNSGEITALVSAGALVWGATNAGATNSGLITAATVDGIDSNDYLHFGVQIWSTDEGNASLVNSAGGSIIAHDGWAAWMLSTDGDVTIDNAGTLLGKSTAVYVGADKITEQWEENPHLADHAGAVGGDLTVENSGLITADEFADFTAGMALVTLAGYDVGTVSVTNLAGGIIGAGFADDTDLSISALASRSGSELAALSGAASNAALSLGVEADTTSIANFGTLVGRVAVTSPFEAFGSGPTSVAGGTLANSGVWLTSGSSGFDTGSAGTISNMGHIFTLGDTTLVGSVENSGSIWISSLGDAAATLTIDGSYAGSGDARLVFDITNDAQQLVSLAGPVSGQTQVVLNNLLDLDWKANGRRDLIDAAPGTPELGADSFVLAADSVHGLVQYELAFDEAAILWSLDAQLSEQSVSQISDVGDVVTTGLGSLTSDVFSRTDELRDMMAPPPQTEPLGYAAADTSSAEDAIAALTPAGEPVLRTWARSQASLGAGADFDAQQRSSTFGLDISNTRGSEAIAIGVFGAVTSAGVDYSLPGSGAELAGRAFGVYGTVANDTGLFSSAVLAVEATDIELALSGETAAFSAWTTGGRVDVGYATHVGDLAIEPSLGVRFGTASYDSFLMSDTIVSLDESVTSAVEARLRVSRTIGLADFDVVPFAIMTIGNRQSSNGTITLSDIGAAGVADDAGLYGGLALGLEATNLDGSLTAFARGDITVTEETRWTSVKLGGTYRF